MGKRQEVAAAAVLTFWSIERDGAAVLQTFSALPWESIAPFQLNFTRAGGVELGESV